MSIGSRSSKRIIIIAIIFLAASILLWRLFFKPHEPASAFLFTNTTSQNIRDEYRQSLSLKDGTPISFTASPGSNSLLTFGLGVPKTDWENETDTYTIKIRVKSGKKEKEYKAELSPAEVKSDRRWKDYSFDLSEFHNRQTQVTLQLTTKERDKEVFLSQMKVVNKQSEIHKPNVLLITIDTLRKDHLSAYGYSKNTSPFLDSFSKSSVVFTKAISTAPLTVPSITSIMTSLYYSEHGLKDNRSVFDQNKMTLAEVFRRNMFSTAAFVGNAVLRKNRNLDKGFDVYNCFLPGTEINRRLPERNAEQLTNAAVAWLRSHKDERWFLWLHYQDPHAPYMPPPPYDIKFKMNSTPVVLRDVKDFTGKGGIPDYAKLPGIFDLNNYLARYDGEIFFADKEIGRFLNELASAQLMDRTIVAITSDHGESLGENEHYFAHGHNVTPELLDVPLILYGENINPQMLQHRVSLIDLPSTLLKLTGIEKPKSFRGKDLFESSKERILFAEQPDKRWAAFKGDDEAIYERTGQFNSPTGWNDGKRIIDQWIQQHVSGGLLFRFADFNGTAILKSNQNLKRIHLSEGEEQDRITLSDKEASIVLNASGNDVDWVFVEPASDAELSISGVNVFDQNGELLNSPFHMEAIPVRTKSSSASNRVSIARIERRTRDLNISTEHAEELKSLGYVAD